MMFRILCGLVAALLTSATCAQELTPQFPPGVFDVLAAGESGSIACTSNCMSTPFFGTSASTPSASATNYSIAASAWGAIMLQRAIVVPVAGTITNLNVVLPQAVTTNYYTISINVNGASSAVKCSVGQGGVNLGTTTTCSDAFGTTADSVAVPAGANISFQSSVPGGTATTISGRTNISALFTSTVGQESFISTATGAPSTSAINYAGVYNSFSTTDALASWVMPVGGTLDHLYAALSTAAGAGKSWEFTVFQNGVATAIVAGNGSTTCGGASSTTCSDTSHAITVSPLDTISIQICPSNTAGCQAGSAPTAASVFAGLRWVPTTTNLAVIPQVASTLPPATTANSFGFIANNGVFNATESAQQNIAPVLGVTMTLGNLTVAQCPGPDTTTGTVTRSVTLRAGGASQTPTATVATGTTACPTLSTIQDTTHTYAASTGALLDLLTSVNNATNAAALTEFKTSMTVTVP